jgi:biotin carboxyl carrier protein
MGDPKADPLDRTPPDGLDASAAAEAPATTSAGTTTLESHEDLERLLPVTSWRGWLIAACAFMVVAAALLYAASSSRLVTVGGIGRATDPNGIRLVSATAAGQMEQYTVTVGQRVDEGQIVAYVVTGNTRVPQKTRNAGTVLDTLLRPGDPVDVGEWIVEIASTETDGKRVIVSFSEADGSRLAVGQRAVVTVSASLTDSGGTVTDGTVTGVSKSIAPLAVQIGLALREEPSGDQIVAEIELDDPIGPGSKVSADVIVSERNLLQQLLGLS